MKQIQLFKLTAMGILMLSIGCKSDDDTVTMENACTVPSNLEIVAYNNASQVVLGWDEITDESAETTFEIEYGLTGFEQGSGMLEEVTTNTNSVGGLNFNAAYDFYVRSVCAAGTSEWIGPVTNTIEVLPNSVTTFMNANIAGTQYNNMVPFLYPTGFTDATRVVTFDASGDELFLAIQGNSAPTDGTFENSKEINLFIPQSQWAPGTYLLYDSSVLNNVPQSNVNMVYFDSASGSTQAFEEEDGSITITEFNLDERFISGTFEFRFVVYYNDTGTTSSIMQCQNGTFTYELDADYFD